MITLLQLADKILRDEGMDISDCPWAERVSYTGTAPVDLEYAKRRRIYDAIENADRDMRQWFHTNSKKTLLERISFTLDSTERPFPLAYMRYIELVLDEQGREVMVDGFMSQPRLTVARYGAIYVSNRNRITIAPYRLVITRPGYMKLSPDTGNHTLMVYFIREHSLIQQVMTLDDLLPAWPEYTAVGVTQTLDSSDYAQAMGFHYQSGVLAKGSTKFVCGAGIPGLGNLITTVAVETERSVFRAGTMIEFWFKSDTITMSLEPPSIVLGTQALCAVIAATLSFPPLIEVDGWQKIALTVPATYTGIVSMGLKSGTVNAQTFHVDQVVKTQWYDTQPLIGPEDYLNLILPLAARKRLNQDIQREAWKTCEAELQRILGQFKSSDGSGEHQRRLIVKLP